MAHPSTSYTAQLTSYLSWKWNEHLSFPLPGRVLFLFSSLFVFIFISLSTVLVHVFIRSYSWSHFYIITTNILLSRLIATDGYSSHSGSGRACSGGCCVDEDWAAEVEQRANVNSRLRSSVNGGSKEDMKAKAQRTGHGRGK